MDDSEQWNLIKDLANVQNDEDEQRLRSIIESLWAIGNDESTTMPNNLAYSYIRFSSPKQELGDSLRRQTQLSDAYVTKNNLTLDTSLNLRDLGVSAFTKKNVEQGALSIFLSAIQSGKVKPGSFLLVESLDRISRAEVMDALTIFTSIINAGITIVTLTDNQVYSRESIKQNWAQLVISLAIMSRAFEESATKSKRIKAAWSSRKESLGETKKLSGRCPSWMILSPDRTKLTLKPGSAKLIKRMLAWSLDGMGAPSMAKKMNELGIAPLSGGKSWNPCTVAKIITSPSLYGEANFKGTGPIPDYYPVVITKEYWLKVQQFRHERFHVGQPRRYGQVPNLFAGILECGYCGERMRIRGATDRDGKSFRYYLCQKGLEGRGCYTPQWISKDFETLVLTYLHELDVSSIISETTAASSLDDLRERKEDMLRNISDIDKRIKNLVSALSEGPSDLQPRSVIESIGNLEQSSLDLNRDLQKLNEMITKEEQSGNHLLEQQRNLSELISVLSEKDELKLLTIRMKVSESIKRIVKKIQVFPAGSFPGTYMEKGKIKVGKYDKSFRYAVLFFKTGNILREIHEGKTTGVYEFPNTTKE